MTTLPESHWIPEDFKSTFILFVSEKKQKQKKTFISRCLLSQPER